MNHNPKSNDLGEPGSIKQYDRQPAAEDTANTGLKQEGTPIYATADSTLQTPEEHEHDQSIDPRQDQTMSASNDDLNDPLADMRSRQASTE